MPELPRPARRVQLRGVISQIVGVSYCIGALISVAVLIWLQFYSDPSDRALTDWRDRLFLLINATIMAAASVWYIYAGRTLRRFPSSTAIRRILTINILVSIVAVGGILSLVVLFSSLYLIYHLRSYDAWKSSLQPELIS